MEPIPRPAENNEAAEVKEKSIKVAEVRYTHPQLEIPPTNISLFSSTLPEKACSLGHNPPYEMSEQVTLNSKEIEIRGQNLNYFLVLFPFLSVGYLKN